MDSSADEALRRFREKTGFNSRWHEVVVQDAPEVLDAYREFRQAVYDRPVLDPKVQELIIIGVDCYQHWPGIKHHIRHALDLGVTKAELVQTMAIAGLPGGVHAMAFGLMALDEVLSERQASMDMPHREEARAAE